MREAIAAWFAWHRRTQLPDYAACWRARRGRRARRHHGRARLRAGGGGAQPRSTAASTRRCRPTRCRDDAHAGAIDEHRAALSPRRTPSSATTSCRPIRSSAAERPSSASSSVPRCSTATRRAAARAGSDCSVSESPFDAGRGFAERRRRQQDSLQTLRRVAGGTGTRPRRAAEIACVAAAHRALAARGLPGLQRAPDAVQLRIGRRPAQQHHAAQRQSASKKLKGWASDLRAARRATADGVLKAARASG